MNWDEFEEQGGKVGDRVFIYNEEWVVISKQDFNFDKLGNYKRGLVYTNLGLQRIGKKGNPIQIFQQPWKYGWKGNKGVSVEVELR